MKGCAWLFGSPRRCLLNPAENSRALAGISVKPALLQTSCPHALVARASPVQSKCRPAPLESQRCCGSTGRAPRPPADEEETLGPAAPKITHGCGCSPAPHGAGCPRGLTLCSLVFTVATSFRAGTPLPAGTASYLKKVRKRIVLKQNRSQRQPSPGQRKSIPWWRQCQSRWGGLLRQ